MTVPWQSADEEQHSNPDQETVHSDLSHQELELELEFIPTVELCFIKFEVELENHVHSSKTPVSVHDVYFNLHSRTVPEAHNIARNDCVLIGKGGTSACKYQKYTLFIVVITYYEPVKFEYDSCQIKVKTSGKHRKLMLKSSFIALEVGEIGHSMLKVCAVNT